MKNIIFIGQFYEPSEESYLLSLSKVGLPVALQKLAINLIQCLAMNKNINIRLLSMPPLGNYGDKSKALVVRRKEYKLSVLDRDSIDGYSIGYINLPIIKERLKKTHLYNELVKLNSQSKIDEVFIFDIQLPILEAVFSFCAKNQHIKSTLCITDLPNEYSSPNHYSFVRKKIVSLRGKKQLSLITKANRYVLLTEAMRDFFQPGKSYTVVEAISDKVDEEKLIQEIRNLDPRQFIIVYAGLLNIIYGIDALLDAFCDLDIPNSELWLFGSGDAEHTILEHSKSNPRIKYFGYVSQHELNEYCKSANLYVNPRHSTDDYVKYSFPSKNLQYIATGRPLVAYPLPGIPEDYNDHILFADPDDHDSMKFKIEYVYNMSQQELETVARKNIRFVNEKKSLFAQSEKIFNLLQEE